jgi:mannose-1-phosphate guanylyltransferase
MHAGNMLGIVLCAGLGTRLRPLTFALPKPAVPVGPVPAALRNIEQLLSAGLPVVHCNTHYLAEDLEGELRGACRSRSIPESAVRFWSEPDILETGGGIARIAHACAAETGSWQDALVVSGDIVADIPVQRMLAAWGRRSAKQTSLMVSLPLDRPRKDVTWVSESNGTIFGFGADADSEAARQRGLSPRVFSNHQIISETILRRSTIEKKSSIDLFYRNAISQSEEILHVPFDADALWFDIGTPESYLDCINKLAHNPHDMIKSLRLSVISLCLPDQIRLPLQGSGQITNEPDYSNVSLNRFEQSCVVMTNQNTSWTWLGQLHSWPAFLNAGLLEIITRLSDGANKAGSPSSPQLSLPLRLTQLAGGFLMNPESSSLSARRAGFIHAPLPSPLCHHPLLKSPLLVPLDLLAAFAVGSQGRIQLPESPSLFWILFTPPLQ